MSEKPDTTENEETSPEDELALPAITETKAELDNKIIRKLGIVGWEQVEDIILAAMLTGDSIMFYGPKGEAKTEVARRLALALDVDFREIDASKANFEDLGGFPNIIGQSQDPDAPAFIHTPLNIWDVPFIFIDEFARATPHIQNKLMEIIRSRRLMGYPTGAKWVFSAMNPLSDEYIGNNPIDIAAASRFSWVIISPMSANMTIDDLQIVANTRSLDDTSALKYFLGRDSATHKYLPDTFDEGKQNLGDILKEAAKLYDGLSDTTRNATLRYVAEIVKLLKTTEGYDVDGRRASTLNRAILSVYCIRIARIQQDSTANLLNILQDSAYTALNNALAAIDLIIGTDQDKILSPSKLSRVHDSCKTTLATGEAAITYRMITAEDPIETISLIINESVDQMTALSTVSKLLSQYAVASTILASIPNCSDLPGILKGTIVKSAAVIHSIGHKLLKFPNHAIFPFIEYADTGMSGHMDAYNTLQQVLSRADLTDQISMTSMRAAFIAALETAARSLTLSKDDREAKDRENLKSSLNKILEHSDPTSWFYMHLAASHFVPTTVDKDESVSPEKRPILPLPTLTFPMQDENATKIHVLLSNSTVNTVSQGRTSSYPIQQFLAGAVIPGVTDCRKTLDILDEAGIATDSGDSRYSNPILLIAHATYTLYEKYMSIMEPASEIALEYINDRSE